MKIDKSKILQHLQSEVYCRLGVSRTHGVGVFALRMIPKGINPLVSWQSHHEFTFTRGELKGVPRAVRRQMRLFCTYDSQHIQVPVMGLNAMTLGMYLNHSKTPNIALLDSGQFKSLRNIHQNEELFMDYDLAFGEVHDFSQD